MRLNRWVQATQGPPLVELASRAIELSEQGFDVLRTDQGAVDVPPPEVFTETVVNLMGDGLVHRYSPDPGLPALREALARHLAERLGITGRTAAEVVVTTGANQACFAALMCLLEPGDEVLMPAPWYFNHEMILTALGATPVPIRTTAAAAFHPEPEQLRAAITERTRGIVLVNPHNPTGACYPEELLAEIGDLATAHDLWILADQTYHELSFHAAPPRSIASLPAMNDRVITVGSFSKALGLAGWRLGFLTGAPALVEQVIKIQDCSVICACRAGQEGLLAALPTIGHHAKQVATVLERRRDRLIAALAEAGLRDLVPPAGSLFLFLELPGIDDDWAFCRSLLEQQHLVTVPGSVFGPGGAGHIRISFGTTPAARLEEAAKRIARQLESG